MPVAPANPGNGHRVRLGPPGDHAARKQVQYLRKEPCMYRKLLVPLDGSTFGEHALPLALSIARRAQATIELVHVHVPLVYGDYFNDALDQDTCAREQAYLNALVERLATVSRVPVSA